MQDFKDFRNEKRETGGELNPDIMKMITDLTAKYKGADENKLWEAVYKEAMKGYKAGTLKTSDLDAFKSIIYPMLDDAKRKKLDEIILRLKKRDK